MHREAQNGCRLDLLALLGMLARPVRLQEQPEQAPSHIFIAANLSAQRSCIDSVHLCCSGTTINRNYNYNSYSAPPLVGGFGGGFSPFGGGYYAPSPLFGFGPVVSVPVSLNWMDFDLEV